jgi:2-oxoglutarate dehydrogenase E1 component
LILAYRRKGHLVAKTNPIRERKDRQANLDLVNFGFTDADLSSTFEAGKFVGLGKASLKDIVGSSKKMLHHTCGYRI